MGYGAEILPAMSDAVCGGEEQSDATPGKTGPNVHVPASFVAPNSIPIRKHIASSSVRFTSMAEP